MPSGLPVWKLNWIRVIHSLVVVRKRDILPELRTSLDFLMTGSEQKDLPCLNQEGGFGGAACGIGSSMGT